MSKLKTVADGIDQECFTHVYGEVPSEGSRKVLGVCGVCRQPMALADGVTKKDSE